MKIRFKGSKAIKKFFITARYTMIEGEIREFSKEEGEKLLKMFPDTFEEVSEDTMDVKVRNWDSMIKYTPSDKAETAPTEEPEVAFPKKKNKK